MVPPSAIEIEPTAITDTSAVTLPSPTTLPQKVNDRYYRRRTVDHCHPKSQWGVAAPATSAQFKSPAAISSSKPKAKRWDHILSAESLARQPSTLKGAAKFLAKPGLISLGGGLPSSAYFPFTSISAHVPTSADHGFDESSTLMYGTTISANKHDLASGSCIFDIATALNYGQGSGSAQILRWVTEHVELVHSPPYADWGCNMTIGSTSALDMALRMFCSRGEALLTEAYTFPTALESAAPMGIHTIGITMDEQGIVPEQLRNTLKTWDENVRGAKRPRVIYLVPTGQNPTGATMGVERRKEVYRICQEFDIFILEDEPYYFLQMPDYVQGGSLGERAPTNNDVFLKSLISSFLSIDVDGRVMRMDSLSKVVAPGTRMGWVTASEQIIERYKMHTDCSTQGPSGLSQLVMFKLLDEHWSHGGYFDWLKYIRKEYTARRDVIVAACERHLPIEIVSWKPPKAGMFHWLEVDWRKHPGAKRLTQNEIEEQIFMASIEHGALVTRGSWFFANSACEQSSMFFRATFAAAPFDQIDAAIKRFGDAIREVFCLGKIGNGINGVHEICNGH